MALKSHMSPSLPRYRGPWSPLPGPLGLPGLLSMSQLTLQPSARAAVCPRQRADPVPRVAGRSSRPGVRRTRRLPSAAWGAAAPGAPIGAAARFISLTNRGPNRDIRSHTRPQPFDDAVPGAGRTGM